MSGRQAVGKRAEVKRPQEPTRVDLHHCQLFPIPKGRPKTLSCAFHACFVLVRLALPLSAQPTTAADSAREPEIRVLASGFPDYQDRWKTRRLQETACGPLSFLAIAHCMGVRIPDDEVAEMVAGASRAGSSLYELEAMARKYRLYALGVEVSAAQLKELGGYAIVRLSGWQFAAVTGFTKDSIRIVPPLAPPRLVPDTIFERQFGRVGRALLISRNELVPEELGLRRPLVEDAPPGLRASAETISLGKTVIPQWQTAVSLHNESKATRRIMKIKTSCPSTSATVDKTDVGPGESTILRVSGKATSLGSFACKVLITTDGTEEESKVIRIRGYLGPVAVAATPVIKIEDVYQGHGKRLLLPLSLSEGVTSDALRVDVPEGAPITATIVRDERLGPCMDIFFRGTDECGWHRHQLFLRHKDAGKGAGYSIVLAICVAPRFACVPKSLFLDERDLSSSWTRRVLVASGQKNLSRLQFEWSDPAFSRALRVAVGKGVNTGVEVIIDAANPEEVRKLSGRFAALTISTSEGASCTIELHVGLQSFVRDGIARSAKTGAPQRSDQ